MPVCAVCSSPAFHKCAACKSVSYCSPAHQREDWRAHKPQCRSPFLNEDQVATYTLEMAAMVNRKVDLAVGIVQAKMKEKLEMAGLEKDAVVTKMRAQLAQEVMVKRMAQRKLTKLEAQVAAEVLLREQAAEKLTTLAAQVAAAEIQREEAMEKLTHFEALVGSGGVVVEDAGAAGQAAAAVVETREAERVAMEDSFKCCVCIALVFDPVSLPCGHNLCFECLSSLVSSRPSVPPCPSCQLVFVPPLPPAQWCVNTGIVNALAASNGPGYREQASTLTFHSQLRGDNPASALKTLESSAAAQVGGVDLFKSLRLFKGTLAPPLYHALKKTTDDWTKLAMEMIRRGCDVNSGVGALDQCDDFPMAQLLVAKGATKCTSKAVKNFSLYNQVCWNSGYTAVDDLLFALLSLLPQPLSTVDDNLQEILYSSLKLGHKKTALVLLQAEVPIKEDLFAAIKPIHLAASSGSLDAVKLIHARDPTSILSVSTAASQTPLHLACLRGRAEVAMYLIEQGCGAKEKNERDSLGNTALNYAGQWAQGGDKAMKEVVDKLKLVQGY